MIIFALIKIGFLEIRILDIIDVLIVAIAIYRLYKLLKGSLALNIFIGLFKTLFLQLGHFNNTVYSPIVRNKANSGTKKYSETWVASNNGTPIRNQRTIAALYLVLTLYLRIICKLPELFYLCFYFWKRS